MSKADIDQFTEKETAQRRDAIVRLMAQMPPQPRTTPRPVRPQRKAALTASDRKAPAPDAEA